MLDCKRNRLDYGELLRPPSGFEFDRAVATTYSADLGTLLSIPIALVYAQTLEGDLTGTRFQLLEAIKQFSRQVKVYHQKGQLHVPAKLNWLHAYLEDALVAVLPDDAYSAFHPKLWVIRYTPKDEESNVQACYRVIVLSRNLTFDRSWDVAACLDGTIGKKLHNTNQPLIDFIRWLDELSPIPKLEETLEELARVEFATPHPFETHTFHPMGVDGYREHAMVSRKSRDTLVISPFLHKDALSCLRANTQRELSLFSERRELEKLPTDLLRNMQSHHLLDLIVDGERLSNAEEGATDVQQQNLHAKLFLFETKEETSWFIGSANATRAAVEKNVEFMLEIRGKAPATRIRPRIKELTGDKDDSGPFVSFNPEAGGKDDEGERTKQEQTRRFEYALLNSKIHGKVETAENGKNFDLHLTLELERVPTHPNLVLTVKPFNTSQNLKPYRLHPGQRETCVFANLSEVELSRFLHFRIESTDGELQHEFLLRIDIDGLPQDRLDNILRKIIDSSEKFFDYLRFLLADEINKEDLLAAVSAEATTQHPEDIAEGWHFHLPIYEQLLVTASRSPRKLAEVDEIIHHLTGGDSETVIPQYFLSFWEVFRGMIPKTQPEKMK
jgi:hypothetical protein